MLYHKDVYLPQSILVFLRESYNLIWTRHADLARHSDRYGWVPKFESITLSHGKIIEVEFIGGKISKFLFRKQHGRDLDLTFVVMIDGKKSLVKTVWLNKRTDTHRTLDRTKYCQKPLTNQQVAV